MKNFKLTIEYDGTAYHGWQIQKNGRTIQGEIEKALAVMTGNKVRLTGSGRTDAGVHAFAQAANFHCDTGITPEAFQKGLNSLLQDDIVIRSCEEADEKFHARYDAKSKTYHYRILNRPIPAAVSRQYAWFIRKKLDHEAMRSAIIHLIGTHDFKAFEGAGSPRAHTNRCVLNANLSEQDQGYLVFEIEANGFLRFMVRNIMGTLADTGTGRITPDDFKRILLSGDRGQAGVTAPPHGLFLMNVRY
ncbi:tRNA pseudouridine(38-40) synthase TruA [Desulfococcaceae bacterium HSG8]|nr:tRNA pseudouridine(38-40) synthase TruA [Desulfococcaceae bacterium HSG8]